MKDEQDTNETGFAAKLPPSFRPAYQHAYGRCTRCRGEGVVKGLRYEGERKKYKCPECRGLGSVN